MAKHDSTLDALFSALGDPTRRMILSRLARGPASVGELAAPFDMALPSFLAHITKLQAAGLILTSKSGRVRICSLAPDALAPARNWLSEQHDLWSGRLNEFDDYVSSLMKDRKP